MAAALERLAETRPAVHSVAAQRQVQSHRSMRVYFDEVQLTQLNDERVELGAGAWGKVSSPKCLSSQLHYPQAFAEPTIEHAGIQHTTIRFSLFPSLVVHQDCHGFSSVLEICRRHVCTTLNAAVELLTVFLN